MISHSRDHVVSDPVEAHRAFGQHLGFRVLTRNVERTSFKGGLEIKVLGLGSVDNRSGVFILNDLILLRRPHAPRRQAVPALLGEELPERFAGAVFPFSEAHDLISVKRQVLWVLVRSNVLGFGSGQLIPLLARDLAPPTCRAFGGVHEY